MDYTLKKSESVFVAYMIPPNSEDAFKGHWKEETMVVSKATMSRIVVSTLDKIIFMLGVPAKIEA